MALVPDQKFSTFADGGDVAVDDIIVGLRGGINTRFNYTGGLAPGYIVPIAQGGTSATTASQARINLGLGPTDSPAFANVQLTGSILDANGNKSLSVYATSTAVNYVTCVNSATGFAPGFSVGGTDVNIGFGLNCLGAGQFAFSSASSSPFFIISGTSLQHSTTLTFPNTAAARNVTFQDSNGTLAYLSDIPAGTPSALTRTNDTNVTLTLGGTPSTALLQAVSLTMGWTGQLSPDRGGTGVNNGANTLTLAGTLATSGAFASTFTMTGATNVTFPTSGTLATVSGTVSSAQGTANQVLVNGTSGSPQTGAITLTLPQSIATSSSPVFNNLQLSGGFINDTNANHVFGMTGVLNAVNYLDVGNSISGNPIFLQAQGTDTNVSIQYVSKAIGSHNFYSEATSGQLLFLTGTSFAHTTIFSFPTSASSKSVIFPDASGTVTLLGNTSTGSGSVVLATSPTLITPILGVAAATSINFGGSTLSTYTNAGTFTPTLTFGGGSTGLTYTVQSGQYNQIGGVVFFNIVIQVNAVGSSTGVASFNALPVAARVGQTQFVTIAASAITYSGQLKAAIASGGTAIVPLSQATAAGQTQLTNTAFTSGCIIWLSGSYLV